MDPGHDPVLVSEVLHHLAPAAGQIFIDCTVGRGGHAEAIAQHLGPTGLLIALDADPRNLEFAAARLKTAVPATPARFFHANFRQLPEVLKQTGISHVHGILADLGISTNQLMDPRYGMSFDRPAPLDLRINPDDPETGADLINRLSESEIADLLYFLAQEKFARRIARKIVEARRISPITTTDALAGLARSAQWRTGGKPSRIDPATRTFLALRMAVNREVENLAALLKQAPGYLADKGRFAVISFQSTEDRAVKRAFAELRATGQASLLTNKPVIPSPDEIARNPRSRSALLRAIEKRST